MSTLDPSQKAFEAAKNAFRKSLNDEKLFKDLMETTSIQGVWKAARDVQAKQDAERRLRHMAKIKTFLDKLSAYTSTVDTFVQVKPDIMALIWGPIRLLLVMTASITKFADAITQVMTKIGDALPQFVEITKTLSDNDRLKDLLALFYRDILDFHVIALKFFSLSRPQLIFESIWPKKQDKIDVVVSNIERHTTLMTNEVTLQHIREEHELRAQSLAHFDQETDFQESQKFRTLETRVSPRNYDDRLDSLLNRSYEGSVKWLLSNKSFLEWLDNSNPALRLLWLQGIPGAGKTYLSAAAVEEAKTRHRTLFVFASHVDQSNTTARSVLQSLLFQLASDAKDIQSVLIQSNERDLLSGTKYVSELLKTLLNSVGPTYIILDGLDEMEAVERRILLQQITGLETCSEIKILVSSRPEDDIANILEAKASSIRVDKMNSGSIQSYITQRTQDWIHNGDFDRKAQEEIQCMLAPVAANANGMFLYARIIMDNVELFTDMEEIERELKVLPLDLNDAYHRIFARINELQPALRRKAKTILGWTGCAPVPMTRHEMEQALLVDSESKAAPSVIASVNFVRICGPIIEIVDDIPQFVHFTVKEYIFSQQISGFIEKSEANYSLAKSLVTYLCSGVFDIYISDEQLQENILAGKYRLHWFAMSQWIGLTRCCVEKSKDLSAYPDLLALLTRMAVELRNCNYEGQINLTDDIFRSIGLDWPEITEIIRGVLQFHRDDRHTDWNYTNSRTWVNFDPSIMSNMLTRIHEHLEELICDEREHKKRDCHCATLQRHYGTKIFKCTFPSCVLSRQGFHTRRARRTHVEHHSRPWKCSVPSCEFAVIGFATRRGQADHWQKMHRISKPWEPANLPADRISRSDSRVLLFELTKAGDIDEIQRLAAFLEPHESVVQPALHLAAEIGSLPMVEVLSQFYDSWGTSSDYRFLYRSIVKSGNRELFRWLLDKLCSSDRIYHYGLLACEAFAIDSPDMYAEWEEFLLDPSRRLDVSISFLDDSDTYAKADEEERFRPARSLIPQFHKRSVLFSKVAFNATKQNALLEARLIRTWHRLIDLLGSGPLNPHFLGWSLVSLGQSSNLSITIAGELLRLGAPIDFPRGEAARITTTTHAKANQQPGSSVHPNPGNEGVDRRGGWERRRRRRAKRYKGMTALHYASRRTSEQAARFVRFLLEKGANPEYGYIGMKPAQERGAALMQKWLGESWEEVVERTKQTRLETGSEDSEVLLDEVDDDSDGDEENAEKEEAAPNPKRRRKTIKRRCSGSDDGEVAKMSD